MIPVYLSLGSNQGHCRQNIWDAFSLLGKKVGKICSSSSFYETEPWGFEAENRFLNVVAKVETDLSPDELICHLLEIEQLLGRKRSNQEGYQSRPIDIDILFYGNQILNTVDVTVPHPRLHLRNFVLIPLCEMAPGLEHPVFKKTATQLLTECTDAGEIQKRELAFEESIS